MFNHVKGTCILYTVIETGQVSKPRTGLGNGLHKKQKILSKWTENCSELYNYEIYGGNTVLVSSQYPEDDLQQVLCEEVEMAAAAPKKGKVCRC